MRSRLAIVIQIVGFAIGIALLVWIIAQARQDLTPDKIDQLREAEAWRVGLIVVLSVSSVVLNGVMWWAAITPVRRVPLVDCLGVNAVASALALLPFKLSVVFRVLIHRRRHGVPMLTFGGWGAALVALMLAALGPAVGASLLLPGGSMAWWAASIGGGGALLGVGVVLARYFSTGAGWRVLRRVVERVLGERGVRLMNSSPVENAHQGVFMLASPGWTFLGGGLRFTDTMAYAARFWLASSIVGVSISVGDAAVVGVSYFIISVIAPTGSAGVREAGTAGVFALLRIPDPALTVAFVGAIELGVGIVTGVLGALVLNPRRMFAPRVTLADG